MGDSLVPVVAVEDPSEEWGLRLLGGIKEDGPERKVADGTRRKRKTWTVGNTRAEGILPLVRIAGQDGRGTRVLV